jgi:uncharacterized protein (DUF433 family)
VLQHEIPREEPKRDTLYVIAGRHAGGIMPFDEFITSVPDVQGGEPIVRGTRTPVRTIAVLFHQTYAGNPAEARNALPHLTQPQIDAALAYFALHRAEIDTLIARHANALNGAMLAR